MIVTLIHQIIFKKLFFKKNVTTPAIGNPLPGTGSGFRPIGTDPNFVGDLRESFVVGIPILHEDDKSETFKIAKNHTGNGKNKWPVSVSLDWKDIVSILSSSKHIYCLIYFHTTFYLTKTKSQKIVIFSTEILMRKVDLQSVSYFCNFLK